MKIDFYHEAILEKFERFTFIGIQLNRHPGMYVAFLIDKE